jgi:hypothetical protein
MPSVMSLTAHPHATSVCVSLFFSKVQKHREPQMVYSTTKGFGQMCQIHEGKYETQQRQNDICSALLLQTISPKKELYLIFSQSTENKE